MSTSLLLDCVDEGRGVRLRAVAGRVLERNLAAHPEDPEQAAEMTVRAAIDALDELRPSRSRKPRHPWPEGPTALGVPIAPAAPFRSVAREDWSPLDDRKRDEFLAIVRDAAPASDVRLA